MGTTVADVEFPVELERRLTTFDEALSELEDILKNCLLYTSDAADE